jgi:hypothetical protein
LLRRLKTSSSTHSLETGPFQLFSRQHCAGNGSRVVGCVRSATLRWHVVGLRDWRLGRRRCRHAGSGGGVSQSQ